MTSLVLAALARAGLLPALEARRAGDWAKLRAAEGLLFRADLLALGALADEIRQVEIGDVVRVHGPDDHAEGTLWLDDAGTGLELLRAVAVARVLSTPSARIGVDWRRQGLELAQIALGFGASDLRGPVTTKSGLAILPTDLRKVKGRGLVSFSELKRGELAALMLHAGRRAMFVDDEAASLQASKERESDARIHP